MKELPKINTILVVKNRGLGDAVIGLATIQYLRSLFPYSRIVYAVPYWVSDLFKNVQICADEVYPLRLEKIMDWLRCFLSIKTINPDIVFEMNQSGRTRKFFKIFPKPYVFHNHHILTSHVHDQGVIKPNIQRDLDGAWSFLGQPYKLPIPSYLNFCPSMKINNTTKNIIIFGVVATRKTKIWPLQNYAKLAKLIFKNKPSFKIKIPLSKNDIDQEIKKKLSGMNLPPSVSFVESDLCELPKILSESQVYIGNDTGLKHIAISLGVKSYTFFGPEQPQEWHPYSDKEHPYFFLNDLKCRTKISHYCELVECEDMTCLEVFTPDHVWNIVKEALDK